jgi:hypothetical protein
LALLKCSVRSADFLKADCGRDFADCDVEVLEMLLVVALVGTGIKLTPEEFGIGGMAGTVAEVVDGGFWAVFRPDAAAEGEAKAAAEAGAAAAADEACDLRLRRGKCRWSMVKEEKRDRSGEQQRQQQMLERRRRRRGSGGGGGGGTGTDADGVDGRSLDKV